MRSGRALSLWILATLAAPAFAQEQPPAAVLGEPGPSSGPMLNPSLDPFLRPLGGPDEPFRPFVPLGVPDNPACQGIGRRFGLGLLSANYGMPGYGVAWLPQEAVPGTNDSLGVVRQDLSIFAPIAYDGPDAAAVGLGARNSIIYTDVSLPDSGRPFPRYLWDIQAGIAFSHLWDNGWTTGVVVSGGSASDQPFSENRTLVASLAIYTTFPTVGRDAWIVGFSYVPTSDFPYPLPIAAYYWEPDDDLQLCMGVPVFLKWRFTERATFDLFYVPIRNVSTRLTWQPLAFPGVRLYGAFAWSNEAWFLADRTDFETRFYSFEKRVVGGIQIDLIWRLQLDLSAGYVFDRFYFQGKQYTDNERDRIDVAPGIYASLQIRLKF